MPGFAFCFGRNDSKRFAAWVKHYAAKGCSQRKAYGVALDKCRRSTTWPA